VKHPILIIILLLFGQTLVSQIGGNATYTFLQLTNSARVAALGGDNISINDNDLNLVYHNPALLDSSMDNNIVLNYVNYFAGIKYGYVSYAHFFKELGTFAAGVHYINYGDFVKADEKGRIDGTFTASEIALNLFWSRPFFDSLITVGVNLKPIYSVLESYNSFGLAFDAGVNYQSNSKLFSASFVIKNVGSQLKPYVTGNYERLPFDLQLGLTQKLEHAPFRLSATFHHLYKWDLTYDKNSNLAYTAVESSQTSDNYNFNIIDNCFRHTIFSMEFVPSKNFNVILAYNHQRRKEMMVETRPYLVGFSWGFYIKVYKFRISYGQAIYHLAGASNHFSINLNLNDFYSRKN
jgi:hypothetical protein